MNVRSVQHCVSGRRETNTNTDYNWRAEDCCESTCGVLFVGEVLMCYVNNERNTKSVELES